MSRSVDFVIGSSPGPRKKQSKEFSLCYAYPRIDANDEVSSVVGNNHVNPQSPSNDEESTTDGLCVRTDGLTSTVIKPYQLTSLKTIVTESLPRERSTLLEIAVRDVKIHPSFNGSQAPVEIASVALLFGDKLVCRTSSPFNRKLYKLLVNDSSESSDISVRVASRCGGWSNLPLPLPRPPAKDSRVEVDFSIRDALGRIHSGTVLFTISVTIRDSAEPLGKSSVYLYGENENQNETPQPQRPKVIGQTFPVNYFLLEDPALRLEAAPEDVVPSARREESLKAPDVVVSEQPGFSFGDLSLGKWFQARRPLRPSSGGNAHKLRAGRDEIAAITVLRGVEVPVREESALVQPLVEIHWGSVTHSTSASEGPAPVWQQTIEFELPKHGVEQSVKLSLYDQHPIWGLQWLGDASIPLEFNRSYQEVERWIGLSPLCSPVVRFGYVQASPVRSYTRIYILMKMERPGNLVKSTEFKSLDAVAKSIQRCMTVPYKIPGTESLEDCAKLAMLLTPLPSHYGPMNPRQALKLNKVDDYGRAVLLATLLQGLGLDAYVLLGSSQARKLAAFVVSFEENGTTPCLWDPENGDYYNIGDSRCSLIKASRIINHQNIWKNMQKIATVPFNLRFNPKSNKEWQALPNSVTAAGTAMSAREVQTLELDDMTCDEEELRLEIERNLREKLSLWRSNAALTTIFNRHAVTIMRSYLSKFTSRTDPQPDKKELRQLYRAYHTHGFILNLRHGTPSELADQLFATKIHAITGPVEFALVCRIQKHIARTCSIWLAVFYGHCNNNFIPDGTANSTREIQTLEFVNTIWDENELRPEIERNLREKLAESRSNTDLTTIFNSHSVTILRAVDFVLVCRMKQHIAETPQTWKSVVVLRDRD